jgi:hypothetical protein
MHRHRRRQSGLTLIEVVIAIMLGLIVMLAMGILFVDAHKGWLHAFEYVYGDLSSDAHITDITFDRTIRRSSQLSATVDAAGQWMEVHYYADEASSELDRYARFYLAGTELKVDRGELPDRLLIGTEVLAEDVSSVTFALLGAQAQMRMELDNGRVQSMMTSSAMMHNE